MTADEVAETWLATALGGDATLAGLLPGGVHSHPVPQGVSFPAGAFQQTGTDDLMGVGTTRILSTLEYLVKAITDGESYPDAAAARIDQLLHGKAAPVGTGRVVSCVRARTFSLPTSENGKQYRQRGAFYQIQVQEN
ncbi:MAG: hypothetical protein M3P51_15585 [Chloroflexota bacterium]|nr:hypothetical protein [Chloroflexota bacterium]